MTSFKTSFEFTDHTAEDVAPGQICQVIANGVSLLAAARGAPKNALGGIWLNEAIRHRLDLQDGMSAELRGMGATPEPHRVAS